MMNYRMEEKQELVLTGYKKHFSGTPAKRTEQEEEFYVSTRLNQYALAGMSRDCDTTYNVITGFDDGYDFFIAAKLGAWETEHLEEVLGAQDKDRFEKIVVPSLRDRERRISGYAGGETAKESSQRMASVIGVCVGECAGSGDCALVL